MQQKASFHRENGGAAGVSAGGGTAALMMTNIPAPQHPVEKQLDTAAFLGQKQQ